MKDLGPIEHGVYRIQTPEIQSHDYIAQRLKDEDNIAQVLTPHVWELQMNVAEAVTRLVDTRDFNDVLEIGTGTGATTIEVLNANPNLKIEAVDMSDSRLERCRVRLGSAADRVRFNHAEAEEHLSSKEAGTYDCIFTAFSLHNLPLESRLGIVSQVYRVLKPNGVFIDADKHGLINQQKDEEIFQVQLKQIYDGFEDQEFAKRWIKHYLKDREIDMPREEYINQLQSIGFNPRIIFEKGLEVIVVAEK